VTGRQILEELAGVEVAKAISERGDVWVPTSETLAGAYWAAYEGYADRVWEEMSPHLRALQFRKFWLAQFDAPALSELQKTISYCPCSPSCLYNIIQRLWLYGAVPWASR
jgi:hypothetical protein